MSDMGDDFRAMREESKIHRNAKQEWSKELLTEWCTKNQVKFQEIRPWHFRLTKELTVVDIYPQRQRAFLHKTQKWINYKDLIETVTKLL